MPLIGLKDPQLLPEITINTTTYKISPRKKKIKKKNIVARRSISFFVFDRSKVKERFKPIFKKSKLPFEKSESKKLGV